MCHVAGGEHMSWKSVESPFNYTCHIADESTVSNIRVTNARWINWAPDIWHIVVKKKYYNSLFFLYFACVLNFNLNDIIASQTFQCIFFWFSFFSSHFCFTFTWLYMITMRKQTKNKMQFCRICYWSIVKIVLLLSNVTNF